MARRTRDKSSEATTKKESLSNRMRELLSSHFGVAQMRLSADSSVEPASPIRSIARIATEQGFAIAKARTLHKLVRKRLR